MNILYITADRGIPVRGTKGAAVHVRSLCAAFDQLGHQVTIMTPRPGPNPGQPVRARLLEVPLPEDDVSAEQQAIAYADMLLAAAREEVRRGSYDFIYERYSLWSDVGARLQSETGLPFVLEVNAPLLEEAAQYRSLDEVEHAQEIERRQFQGAAAVAVVSESLKDYVRSRADREDNVHVVPNGVDPQHFHPAVRGGRVHHRWGLNGKKVVGFAGRARPWHDIDTLLRAFAMLYAQDANTHLLLVGQMPDDINSRLSQLGIQSAVTQTGPVPHAEVPEHIAAMNVAVSTHAPMDTFYFSPLKLYEYMACGVPVVAAALGQPSQRIQPGINGEVYRPGDAADLAYRIGKLLDQPAYANEIAWNGSVDILQQFTWTHNAQQVIDWIRQAYPSQADANHRPEINLPILDPRLRQRLYRATRPDLVARLLRRKGPERKKYARLNSIEVLKYKPGRRCVLRYSWEKSRQEDAVMIGKVFRDERGERLDAIHKILWRNGLDGGAVRIPQGYGYAKKMRMQLQENAPGITLNDLYRQGSIDHWIPLCARAAADLHSLPDRLPEKDLTRLSKLVGRYFLPEEQRSLANTHTALRQMRPADQLTLEHLYTMLIRSTEMLAPASENALVHRDFYYSQVLIDTDRLVIIDLDLMAFGDAAIDVANFSAHLNFLSLEMHHDFHRLDGAAAAFKSEYQLHRPSDVAFWDRVRFYEAATLYRLLRVVAARPRKAHVFEPLLAAAMESLEVV